MDIYLVRRKNLSTWTKTHSIPTNERSYFSQILNGKAPFGERAARNLERKLGLEDGSLDINSEDDGPEIQLQKKFKRSTIPMISWVQAGGWGDVNDENFEANREYVEANLSKPSRFAFALTVRGDSMTSPIGGATSFPDGCLIIIDPERGPKPGDYVVAKDVSTQKATFKQLTTDGSRWYLKPLNPAYAILEIDDPATRVIGVLIEARQNVKF